MMLTIVGIPFGMQTLKLAGLALWPFGKEVRSGGRSSGLPLYTDELFYGYFWVVFGFVLSHLGFGAVLCITIIGIPLVCSTLSWLR